MDDDMTMIPIKKSTRENLKDFGRKGDTWDDILQNLMKK